MTLELGEALRRCSEIFNSDGPVEIGVREAFVFADAVIVFSMEENEKGERYLQISVAAGEPHYFTESLELLEKEQP